MRVIVCGSAPRVGPPERPGWTDRRLLFAVLDARLHAFCAVPENTPEEFVVVEGEAAGADTMAREWAEERGATVDPFPANWSRGRGAGMIRNRRMLDSGADEVLAFSVAWPPTGGTDGMCSIAEAAGVPVVVVTPDGIARHYAERVAQTELPV